MILPQKSHLMLKIIEENVADIDVITYYKKQVEKLAGESPTTADLIPAKFLSNSMQCNISAVKVPKEIVAAKTNEVQKFYAPLPPSSHNRSQSLAQKKSIVLKQLQHQQRTSEPKRQQQRESVLYMQPQCPDQKTASILFENRISKEGSQNLSEGLFSTSSRLNHHSMPIQSHLLSQPERQKIANLPVQYLPLNVSQMIQNVENRRYITEPDSEESALMRALHCQAEKRRENLRNYIEEWTVGKRTSDQHEQSFANRSYQRPQVFGDSNHSPRARSTHQHLAFNFGSANLNCNDQLSCDITDNQQLKGTTAAACRANAVASIEKRLSGGLLREHRERPTESAKRPRKKQQKLLKQILREFKISCAKRTTQSKQQTNNSADLFEKKTGEQEGEGAEQQEQEREYDNGDNDNDNDNDDNYNYNYNYNNYNDNDDEEDVGISTAAPSQQPSAPQSCNKCEIASTPEILEERQETPIETKQNSSNTVSDKGKQFVQVSKHLQHRRHHSVRKPESNVVQMQNNLRIGRNFAVAQKYPCILKKDEVGRVAQNLQFQSTMRDRSLFVVSSGNDEREADCFLTQFLKKIKNQKQLQNYQILVSEC